MEIMLSYLYVNTSTNNDSTCLNYQSLKSSLEWSKGQDIRFSVHLGGYDSNNSNELWRECIDSIGIHAVSNLIINLKLTSGNKSKEMDLFSKAYVELPDSIKNKLRLENDAKIFSVSDVVAISEKTGIPIVINVFNDMKYPSAPLDESIDRIITSMPTRMPEFSFVSDSRRLDITYFMKWIHNLCHNEKLSSKHVNAIVAYTDHEDAILKINKTIESERLQMDFLKIVESKLRKSENEIWYKPDHDHLDKHLK